MGSWQRELWLLRRDRAAVSALVIALVLASAAVLLGTHEVSTQRAQIERLLRSDAEERDAMRDAHADDAGSVAYYSFHLTYAPPSPLAFASLGSRQTHPWRHRLRMLALEGQIYEVDPGNPALVQSGVLDFALVASALLPLLVIVLLHDIIARERHAGRFELLQASAGSGERLFRLRASVRALLLWATLALPFVLGAIAQGSAWLPIVGVLAMLALHIAFWAVLALWVAQRIDAAATVATAMVGVWIAFTLVVPQLGAVLAQGRVATPSGGELLLAQRERVNDAWDLPKDATMEPFVDAYPAWREHAQITRPFEWKWYYAFQEVGDLSVAETSTSLREGLRRRDAIMGAIALASPPLWVNRTLERLAATDIDGYLRYEQCARDFHAQLRDHYYPILFQGAPLSPTPRYTPCS